MKIVDSRKIEIRDTEDNYLVWEGDLKEAQELYDALGNLDGIKTHGIKMPPFNPNTLVPRLPEPLRTIEPWTGHPRPSGYPKVTWSDISHRRPTPQAVANVYGGPGNA